MSKQNILPILLIVCLGLGVYANSLKNEFVWDDIVHIVNNAHITNLKYLNEAFLYPLGYFSEYSDQEIPFYRPMQSISVIVDYFLWGKNPLGYHLTNILFHIFAAVLVYFLISRLSCSYFISFVASLIFLIHPVQTEAVTYVAGRSDPMVFAFMLAALILYAKSNTNRLTKRLPYYFASLGAFIFALLSKELAIIFPALLVIYDLYTKKSSFKNLPHKKYLPYILLIAGFLVLHKMITTAVEAQTSSFGERFMMSGYVLLKYIKLLFLPFGLHMEYSIPTPPLIIIYSSFILLSGLFLIVHLNRNKSRLLYFGVSWFFVTLFPMLNVIRKLNAPMSEHWLYIPVVGFGIVMGVFLESLRQRIHKQYSKNISRAIIFSIILTMVFYYSSLTMLRNRDWRDNLTFLKKTFEYSPRSARVAMDIAIEYVERKDFQNAEAYFKKALSVDPFYSHLHYNFARMYEEKGDVDSAIQEYKNELKAYPKNISAINNLGVLYKSAGKFELAIEQYNNILRIDPGNLAAHYNLGTVFESKGETDKAKECFKKALSIDPRFELAKDALRTIDK